MFEKEGISQKDLDRIKAGQETQFYNSLSSVLGKGVQLTQCSIFAGDPGCITKNIAAIQAVTPADVKNVYEKYIKGKNYVATSFVPKGATALALEGSKVAEVVIEPIVQGAEDAVDPNVNAEYKKTPSSFDRSVEPPYGKSPELKIPTVWQSKLKNGLRVYGIENAEVPLVQFEIIIDGGQLLEPADKQGVASLTARLMNYGTKNKTPQELEEAIQQLGASIGFSGGKEGITVRATTLARNYDATLALVQEMLLEPRWDAKEFDLLKQSTVSQIRQMSANPNAIAQEKFNELAYGKGNVFAKAAIGTIDSVNGITLDDLKAYYEKNLSPSVARMHVVGDIGKSKVTASLKGLNSNWKKKDVKLPSFTLPAAPSRAQIYFYDVPNASQSVLRIGYPALKETDADFYPATVANYILGGGGFASRLTQELREGKGYTYGINSNFSGSSNSGLFTIGSGVRSNVTLESLQLVKSILEAYPKTFSDQDLETTKGFLVKSNARAFETSNAKLGMLDKISSYGWKPDYVKSREGIVKAMTVDRINTLSGKYFDPNKMIWVVVGDAKTQLPRLKELGLGEPVVLNK